MWLRLISGGLFAGGAVYIATQVNMISQIQGVGILVPLMWAMFGLVLLCTGGAILFQRKEYADESPPG